LIGGAILAIVCGSLGARAYFLDTLAWNLDVNQPGADIVLDWLTENAPSDPVAHLRAALYYERTFDAANLERALSEYRKAADSAPNNYVVWMNLALALSRSGDTAAAETAFLRARDLAPHYSEVEWAYGNFLVRQGREDEGFPLIAHAASVDPKIAGPAVSITLQVAGGDIERTRTVLGASPPIEMALATTLSVLKKYDEARDAWLRIPIEMRRGVYRTDGERLRNLFITSGNFRSAAAVAADLADSDEVKPALGQINNGGFESGVKLRTPGQFEWQIADGPEPQIGLSELQVHSGRYSLSIVFNTFRPEGFRDVSQMIPVEPGRRYRLEVWYRSSVKATAEFKWQVANAASRAPIATTPAMTPTAEWAPLSVSFVVPDGVDGLKLSLLREGCGGPACPVSGTLVFDDIALIRE
jgi:hypothetical protein